MTTTRSAALAVVGAVARVGGDRPPRSRQAGPPVVIVGASATAPAIGPLAASRAFVAAYERFIYGRLGPARLPNVSPYVRRQLAAQRPDPPAAVVAAADPRLRSLTLDRRGRDARAHAVVVDGPATYAIRLELKRRNGVWTVIGLTETG
jgi:hypothetical protein